MNDVFSLGTAANVKLQQPYPFVLISNCCVATPSNPSCSGGRQLTSTAAAAESPLSLDSFGCRADGAGGGGAP